VPVATDAQQQRRTLARQDHAGQPFLDHGDGVGADQLPGGDAHGIEQLGRCFQGVADEVGDGLGVGLGGEDIALRYQAPANLGEVFDDAVVHYGQSARHMRVGIALGGRAVRRPTRVGDADAGHLPLGLRGQVGDAADAAQTVQLRL